MAQKKATKSGGGYKRQVPQLAASTKQYTEGQQAFREGLPTDACPYPKGEWNLRTCWLAGFYDARTTAKLRDTFTRLGITYP